MVRESHRRSGVKSIDTFLNFIEKRNIAFIYLLCVKLSMPTNKNASSNKYLLQLVVK